MRYNLAMLRAMKMATAALLALALAAFPFVLDRCTESCEAQRDAVASTPTCHHATATGTHLGAVPSPCGHDHNGASATTAQNAPALERSLSSVVAVAAHTLPIAAQASGWRFLAHAPPGSPQALASRTLPLRL